MQRRCIIYVFIIMLCALSAPVAASEFPNGVSAAEIEEIINSKLKPSGRSVLLKMAAARRFPPCNHVPEVAAHNEDDWSTATLKCSEPKIWERSVRTYLGAVPKVEKREYASNEIEILGLKTSLSQGAVITRDHLTFVKVKANTAVGYFTDVHALVGRKMLKPLGQGRPILARHLQQKWAIELNAPVQIVYDTGGLMVLAPGVALENGQFGDLISAQNSATGMSVKGHVVGRNKIKVRAKLK